MDGGIDGGRKGRGKQGGRIKENGEKWRGKNVRGDGRMRVLEMGRR